MLHFITGTFNSPKREYISEKISEAADAGLKPVLIVPEQAAFGRERDYLLTAGAVRSNCLTVTGFSRIIRTLLPFADIKMKPVASPDVRGVLMSLACEEASEDLEIYASHRASGRLVKELLAQYSEIRRARLGITEMEQAVKSLPDGSLKRKMRELSVIFSTYEALLSDGWSDEDDAVPLTEEYLKTHNFLSESVVFIDDFRGFTAAQLSLVKQMILSAKDVYISVFAPSVNAFPADDTSNACAFGSVHSLCLGLKQFARENGVRVFADDPGDGGRSELMRAVHSGFYAAAPGEYVTEGQTDEINIIEGADINSEAALVALEIKNLIEKENIRCSQTAVVCRNSSYVAPVTSALRRCGLPVFRDRSTLLTEYPVGRYLLGAVRLAAGGFDTENVISYIKSGMTGLSAVDGGDLESYAFIWQIEGRKWENDFTGSPFGFGVRADERSKAELERLNGLRKALVTPVLKLRQGLGGGAAAACRAMWDFLDETGARDRFCDYAQGLLDAGDEEGALSCSGVWDKLIGILDCVCTALGERSVSAQRMYEILEIMLSSVTLGQVPAGIDEISVGLADRVRFSSPRAVFLVGCNKGVFPAETVNRGMFTSAEKRVLTGCGFELFSTPEKEFDDERLITCASVFSGENKIFASYSVRTLSGEPTDPSEIIEILSFLAPGHRRVTPESYGGCEKICSPETAYSEYASVYGTGSVYEASLREYCRGVPLLASRLPSLDAEARHIPAGFADENNALDFYGETLTVSPSQAEKYYNCPFGYFCAYSLGITPPDIAGMTPGIRGSMIHDVLERILKKHPKDEFIALTRDEVAAEVKYFSERYISEKMAGRDDKSATLNREFDNVEAVLMNIIPRMQSEFSLTDFTFRDMELKIGGGSNADADAYRIPLEKGGMKIIGKIDRADTYENEKGTYVRIVDYKSGSKSFDAGDIPNGLNLQMPIYLFSLLKGGKPPYKNALPAGFLYMPAKADDSLSSANLGRNATGEEADAIRAKDGRLFGMVLEDADIIRAMNPETIRLKKPDKNGGYHDGTLSPREFRGLEIKLNEILSDMGNALHKGQIPALPVARRTMPCEYCKFGDVCRRESDGVCRHPVKYSSDDLKEELKRTEEQSHINENREEGI